MEKHSQENRWKAELSSGAGRKMQESHLQPRMGAPWTPPKLQEFLPLASRSDFSLQKKSPELCSPPQKAPDGAVPALLLLLRGHSRLSPGCWNHPDAKFALGEQQEGLRKGKMHIPAVPLGSARGRNFKSILCVKRNIWAGSPAVLSKLEFWRDASRLKNQTTVLLVRLKD